MPAVTGTDVYGWHHMRSFDHWSAARLCTFSYAKHNGIFGMNIYHVPIVPIFIMIFLVGLLQIVLSCVLSINLKKETLVERIRYQG